MTGFGHGTATGTKGIVTAEIKTVNNRFLELIYVLTIFLQPRKKV